MDRIRASWRNLSRRAKVVVGIIVALLALGGIGAVAGDPAAEQTANATPTVAVASKSPAAVKATDTATLEPTSAPTPEDAPEQTPEVTPEATAAPTAPPILITSGRGDKVVKLPAQDGPTYAKVTGKGGGNFAVISYTGSEYGDLLVNSIGSYSGSVYIAAGINRLKVTSSGSWTIQVRPVTSAKHWDGTTALAGKGDGVVNLAGGASGITTIKNKGKSNFAVIAYTPEGDYLDLLVNEIGSYKGEVLLPDSDPMVLVIHGDGGSWSFSTVEQ